ncbi:kelch-like protein 12 [Lingula anatina]|uniref:Kelch-like protein 12 n=1 Tax=Lingula anatina TaxID=7574 RepID=A0A1S3J396_LINAN|nr:kelch-like protein 12 [Lingula anatina]XP_013404723.1 kelch-like protein 12 [Lingula anatina]XP_023931277.1 kelch-like protein 12 [Lingula anatina]XP_023931278.1 kelch-like protein 12 [Lingula anatina]|eukprot:XP_013404713.1 kelch-like protein 12 [Lingula anatina]
MADISQSTDDQITLVVDGHSLQCGRDVLRKASPYFEAMFNSDMMESTANCVNLKGASYESVELLIQFANNQDISITWDNVYALLETACMYQFSNVSDKCSSFLLKHLGTSNCLRSMYLADVLSLKNLYNQAKRWAVWFFEEVTQQDDFMQMDIRALTDYLSCEYLQTSSEANVLWCVLRWIEYDKDERLGQLPVILKLVRFELIASNEIQEVIEMCPIVKSNAEIQNMLKEYFKMAAVADFKKDPRGIPLRLGIVGGNHTPLENGDVQPNLSVQYLDPDQGLLQELCSLKNVFSNSKQINGSKACVIGKDLYVTGGEAKLGHNQWFYDVWKFDSISEQWEIITQLRQPRRHHGLCVWDESFYLVGGFGRHRLVLDSVEKYNTKTGQWIKCAALLTPQYSAAAAVCNDKLYVIKHDIQCYEPTLDYWIHLKIPLPFENGLHCAMTRGKVIYLTGQYILDLLEFDTVAKKFSKRGKFRKALGSACIVQDTIFVVAGEECNVIESFDLISGKFDEVLHLDYYLNNHNAVTIPIFPKFS